VLRLKQACDLESVHATAMSLRQFLTSAGCTQAEVADSELALVEACNNAVLHVGPGGIGQSIGVEASCNAERIAISVLDHTPGFDWREKVSLPEPESEGGRGLYLIQSVMDSARYVRSPAGNTLFLCKKRHRSISESANQ
jgi:serine/threonine-protein kinase RsbW